MVPETKRKNQFCKKICDGFEFYGTQYGREVRLKATLQVAVPSLRGSTCFLPASLVQTHGKTGRHPLFTSTLLGARYPLYAGGVLMRWQVAGDRSSVGVMIDGMFRKPSTCMRFHTCAACLNGCRIGYFSGAKEDGWGQYYSVSSRRRISFDVTTTASIINTTTHFSPWPISPPLVKISAGAPEKTRSSTATESLMILHAAWRAPGAPPSARSAATSTRSRPTPTPQPLLLLVRASGKS